MQPQRLVNGAIRWKSAMNDNSPSVSRNTNSYSQTIVYVRYCNYDTLNEETDVKYIHTNFL